MKEDRRAALIAKFQALSQERLERLNNGLVELEQRPDNPTLVADVMREIHTLKGEANLMGFADVNLAAHRVEDVLIASKARNFASESTPFDLILRGFDLIGRLLRKQTGSTQEGLDLDAFVRSVELFSRESEGGQDTSVAQAQPAQAQPAQAQPAQAGDKSSPPIESQNKAAASDTKDSEKKQDRQTRTKSDTQGTIRVDVRRLDTLTDIAGELLRYHAENMSMLRALGVIGESWREHLQELGRRISHLRNANLTETQRHDLTEIHEILLRLSSLRDQFATVSTSSRESAADREERLAQLETAARDLRLMPLSSLLARYPRAIRDIAKDQGKNVEVTMDGGDVDVDNRVLELLDDPLLHLIRNAIDHGIETPEERTKRGKRPAGRLTVNAEQRGVHVRITVRDDGRGVSPDLVRQAAVQRGIMSKQRADEMTQEDLVNLIFLPAFSTRARATDLSGRGVGLDVVKERIEQMGGTVNLESREGLGTEIILRVPLSIILMRGLVVEAGDNLYAFPSHAVASVADIYPEDLEPVGNGLFFRLHDTPVPLHDLSQMMGRGPTQTEAGQASRVVVVENQPRRIGLLVRRSLGERELVQRPLNAFLAGMRLLIGTTVLERGQAVFIINVPELIRRASQSVERAQTTQQVTKRKALILVVEDSELTRDMIESVLRTAGHHVLEASNGSEALDRIHQQKPDLVLTDLDMPVMDGFELIKQIRKEDTTHDLPVVVLSTHGSAEDKQTAAELGADAYVVKSEFKEDTLLETIVRLLSM